MKCKKCGSNLSIDDERCLFCGAENTFAVKHRKEMRHFTKEFHETTAEVLHKSKRLNQWTVKIMLIAVLIAASLGLFIFNDNIYGFERFLNERKINANLEWYKAQLDTLEENRDYIALACFWEDYELSDCDNLDEYEMVVRCCSSFRYVYQYTMDIVTTEETDYYSHEDRAGYAADNVNYVYEYSKKKEYYDEDQYSRRHQACMNDLVEDMEALIQTYYGLSDEEMGSFSELSEAKRQVLMEEGVKLYEQTE